MTELALLRGPEISLDPFLRAGLERRGLWRERPGEASREPRAERLADGSILVDLMPDRAEWSWAWIVGDAALRHEDPRGIFVFPYAARGDAEDAASLIAAVGGRGAWWPVPSLPPASLGMAARSVLAHALVGVFVVPLAPLAFGWALASRRLSGKGGVGVLLAQVPFVLWGLFALTGKVPPVPLAASMGAVAAVVLAGQAIRTERISRRAARRRRTS